MLQFLVRRLALAVPTLILASMIIFALQQLLPGDTATALDLLVDFRVLLRKRQVEQPDVLLE